MATFGKPLTIKFGSQGNDRQHLRTGWGEADLDRRAMVGASCWLELDRPDHRGDYLLLLALDQAPGRTGAAQRLSVDVNGVRLEELTVKTSNILCRRIPWNALSAHDHVVITFETPEVCSNQPPSRGFGSFLFRELSIQPFTDSAPDQDRGAGDEQDGTVESSSLLISQSALLRHFASLGDNCEFGLLQRRAGAEAPSLLRFVTFLGAFAGRLAAINDGFQRIEDPNMITLSLHGEEYVLHHAAYDFISHTEILEGTIDPWRLFNREFNKLTMLVRMFMEVLRSGSKMFVFKQNHGTSLEDARALSAALRAYGPNDLLYVELAQSSTDIGTVEIVGEGLFRGKIDAFLPYDMANLPASDVWIALCRAAYDLRNSHRLGYDPSLGTTKNVLELNA
jgi:hypothetical protein